MRQETLTELTRVFEEMALLIRHRALPVKDLFTELSRYEFIDGVVKRGGADFRQSWLAAAESLTELQEAERGVIKSTGLSLGTSDVEGQLAMLKLNAALLKRYGDEAREQYLKKGKLYRSMGTLAGMFVAVLVI